jgi:tetratricopeptide (TPR) repeat protein
MRIFVFFVMVLLLSCADHSREGFNIPVIQKQNKENQQLAALSLLSDAIKNNPSDYDNYLKRAKLHYSLENFQEALVDITRAERLNPNSGLILFQKATILNALKDKNALDSAQDAENQGFDSPDLYALLAELSIKAKDFRAAQQYLDKSENIYPYNSGLYLVRGLYYAHQNDTLKAIFNYKKAQSLRPHDFEPYDALIKIYNQQNSIDSALIYNEKALKRFPSKKELVFNRAQILQNGGALDSATKVYQRFLRLEPSRYDVLEKVGDIYFKKKNYASAFLIYDKWSKAMPESVEAVRKAALCYVEQKKYAYANTYLEKGLDRFPENKTLLAEISKIKYVMDAKVNLYTNPPQYYNRPKEKEVEVVEDPQRRLFDIGNVEKIKKRGPVTIAKDTVRN